MLSLLFFIHIICLISRYVKGSVIDLVARSIFSILDCNSVNYPVLLLCCMQLMCMLIKITYVLDMNWSCVRMHLVFVALLYYADGFSACEIIFYIIILPRIYLFLNIMYGSYFPRIIFCCDCSFCFLASVIRYIALITI